MSETQLKIELVTPKGTGLSEDATFVKLPAQGGEVGVYPNHSPTLALLSPGELIVRTGETDTPYFVSEGIAHIDKTKVTVICPFIEKVSETDTQRANQSKIRAEQRLTGKDSGINILRAKQALKRADTRLELAQRHH